MVSFHRFLVVICAALVMGGVRIHAGGVVAQSTSGGSTRAARAADAAGGEIVGLVTDAEGQPLEGAMVSAFGPDGAELVLSGTDGRFSFRELAAGAYLIQAHHAGFAASRREVVEVDPGRPTVLPFVLSRVTEDATVEPLIAGFGVARPAAAAQADAPEPVADAPPATLAPHEHTEKAWRLRRARRTVLKDATAGTFAGRLVDADARIALSQSGDALRDGGPWNARVNLLTRGSFESPGPLGGGTPGSAGIANVAVGSPVWGGDWSAQGAMTTGDVSSWVVAGEWVADSDTAHQLGLDVSYGRQQYQGGNPAALTVASETRYAASFGVSDVWELSRALTVELGARYATYGYLEDRGLFSPRAAVTYEVAPGFRLRMAGSRETTAPGAEEFLPPVDSELWLPPERTFAALLPENGLHAQRTGHVEIGIEQDVADGFVVGVRRFYQDVTDQMATLFGIDGVGSAPTGHYSLARAGGVTSRGWILTVKRHLGKRFRGSVDYAMADAFWAQASADTELGVAVPGAIRPPTEWFHDFSATVEAHIAETSTHVYVRCRVSGGFVPTESNETDGMEPRFDIRVRQALPFSPLDTARWEMLVAVRSLFFGPQSAASMFDELLVARPPKQVVGGLVVHF